MAAYSIESKKSKEVKTNVNKVVQTQRSIPNGNRSHRRPIEAAQNVGCDGQGPRKARQNSSVAGRARVPVLSRCSFGSPKGKTHRRMMKIRGVGAEIPTRSARACHRDR